MWRLRRVGYLVGLGMWFHHNRVKIDQIDVNVCFLKHQVKVVLLSQVGRMVKSELLSLFQA